MSVLKSLTKCPPAPVSRNTCNEGARLRSIAFKVQLIASVAASNNVPLHMIGSLLGHKQHATTFRYAHLANDDKKIAAEKGGLHLNF